MNPSNTTLPSGCSTGSAPPLQWNEFPVDEIGRGNSLSPTCAGQHALCERVSRQARLRKPAEALSVLKGEPSPVHGNDLELTRVASEDVLSAHAVPLDQQMRPETSLDLTHLVRPVLVVPGFTAVIDESITAVGAFFIMAVVILSMRLML